MQVLDQLTNFIRGLSDSGMRLLSASAIMACVVFLFYIVYRVVRKVGTGT